MTLKKDSGRLFIMKRKTLNNELQQLQLRLLHQNPARKISERKILLKNIQKDLFNNLSGRLAAFKERVRKSSAVLESLNPLGVLQRGYSITRSIASGMIVRQADDLSIGEDVNIQLARGNFNAKIEKIFQG